MFSSLVYYPTLCSQYVSHEYAIAGIDGGLNLLDQSPAGEVRIHSKKIQCEEDLGGESEEEDDLFNLFPFTHSTSTGFRLLVLLMNVNQPLKSVD